MSIVKKKLYFAYGSNMSQARLEKRVGKVVKVGTYVLEYWKLNFNCGSPKQRFANITMTGYKNDFVEGVLYELTPRQFRILDYYEGYPFLYQKIALPSEGSGLVLTYACFNPHYSPSPKIKANAEYMQHILQGCNENNLLETAKKLLIFKKEGLVLF